MIVWMSSLRRGFVYHLLGEDENKALCGKELEGGYRLGRIRAVDEFAAHCCRKCAEAEP